MKIFKYRPWPRPSYTLTELLVVMAIMGVMASMLLAAVAGAVGDARKQRTIMIITKIDRILTEKVNDFRYRSVRLQLPTGAAGVIQTAGAGGQSLQARWQLYALRDMMRMELPDRYSDFVDPNTMAIVGPADLGVNENIGGVRLGTVPAVTMGYWRQIQKNNPSPTIANENESAECLYLILSQMRDGDRTAIASFSKDEIGDFDNDNMPEILDGWGRPISFLRWAPGYVANPPNWNDWTAVSNSSIAAVNSGYPVLTSQWVYQQYTDTLQANDPPTGEVNPELSQVDSLDLMKSDPRWPVRFANGTNVVNQSRYPMNPSNWQVNGRPVAWRPFALRPLIFSNGPDKQGDIRMTYDSSNPSDPRFAYGATGAFDVQLNGVGNVKIPVDPYHISAPNQNPEPWIGACVDTDGNGRMWDSLSNGNPLGNGRPEYVDNITNHAIELGGEDNR